MIHILYKVRRFFTSQTDQLNPNLVNEYASFIKCNPKEVYVPYIQNKKEINNNLVLIIKRLEVYRSWEQINTLLPMVTESNYNSPAEFLSLFSLTKRFKFNQTHLDILLYAIRQRSGLTPRSVSEVIRSLPLVQLKTVDKFEIIKILSEEILNNLQEYSSFDRAYIVEGIVRYPCEECHRLFKAFALDSSKKRSVKELSTLCNYLTFNRMSEFLYLFDELENEILKNSSEIKYVLFQALHSFAKIGKGSRFLSRYFVIKIEEIQYEIDNETLGVALCSMLKLNSINPSEVQSVIEIFKKHKKKLSLKHINYFEYLVSKKLKLKSN